MNLVYQLLLDLLSPFVHFSDWPFLPFLHAGLCCSSENISGQLDPGFYRPDATYVVKET